MHTSIRQIAIALTPLLTACPCWVSFTDNHECPANQATAAATGIATALGSETTTTATSSGGATATTTSSDETAPTTGPQSTTASETGLEPTIDPVASTGSPPVCGDGIVDRGEACDDGNDIDHDDCTVECESQDCRNGIREGIEECDAGEQPSAECDPDCTFVECGDKITNTEAGETCDFGPDNVDTGTCTTSCIYAACGDGHVWQGFEECDDGNRDHTDACVLCHTAKCGDSWIWQGQEECDDGGYEEGDGCSSGCIAHKVVFTTSQTFDGNLGGLTGADAKCQAAAAAAQLPGVFKAWLSDDTGSPVTRFNHAEMPYRQRDGFLVATGWSDLVDGALSAAISLSEIKTTPGFDPNLCNDFAKGIAFTNTASDGTAIDNAADCAGWTSNAPASFAAAGHWSSVGTMWSNYCQASCAWKKALYCVQQ